MLLRYYKTHAYATPALDRTVKPYNYISGNQAAHRIPVSHTATSCVYFLGGWVGWRGFSLPARVSSRAKHMARVGGFWKNRKPASGTRSETMPDMRGRQRVGTRQSESLGGSAASGGGVGGDHGVRYGFSLDGSEVVLACGESLFSSMMDAGKFESDVDVQYQQMMDRLRQEAQLQLQQLRRQRPLPLDSLCNPYHQASEQHNHRRLTPRPDSPGNQGKAVDPPSQQQQLGMALPC